MDRDVGHWLEGLQLSQYADTFAENAVDFNLLAELTDADLKEMGIAALGHRKRILRATANLREVETAGTPIGLPAAARSETSGAERRNLTVMFVDLVGSTALSTRIDPEEMGSVIRAYQNAVAGEIARLEGHVAKFMGDGVLAYFGWPRAHEDEAERAVRAGLAIVDAVARLEVDSSPLACRVGIATGLVVVGELVGEGAALERTVAGETPNLAARLQTKARPGEVMVSDSTHARISGTFRLEAQAPQEMKGIDGRVAFFRVLGERSIESRFAAQTEGAAAPIVGRDQELALLVERWETACRGEGQAVMLIGEAGIGKSRIVRALEDELDGSTYTRVLYQCSPFHTDSAFWPVTQQLSRAAQFEQDDDVETRLDKLEALVGKDDAPLLATLLEIDGGARYGAMNLTPAAQRAQTLEALARQPVRLASTRPVAFFLEDVHWIDPTTLELLELVIDAVAAIPVLIVVTSRPDNPPALAAHPHVTRLALNRLGRAGVDAIVERLGGANLSSETVAAIIARTDGVPLFVEELTKAVLESGDIAIPASLHDSLMARLDRSPEAKDIAQCAACIGREFDLGLLMAATERSESELRAGLESLVAAELVFRRGVGQSGRYVFKHALVRDAAYESLLISRRRAVHARLAEALEGKAPAEIVARHAEAAGQTDSAIARYKQAGEAAIARPAYREAAAHFGAALRLLGSHDERRSEALSIATRRGVALIGAEGYAAAETIAAFAQARRLLDSLGDAPEWPAVRYGNWVGSYVSANLADAASLSLELLTDCERADPHQFLGVANRMLGTSLAMMGKFQEALHHLEKAVALYDPVRDRDHARRLGTDSGAGAHVYSALVNWFLGHIEVSRAHLRSALEFAEQQDHPALSRDYTIGHISFAKTCEGSADALDWADKVIELSTRDQVDTWHVFGLTSRAAARVAVGDYVRALEDARLSRAGMRREGTRLFLGITFRAEARALIGLGALDKAADALTEMEQMIAATGQRWDEADFRCVEAELALARGDAVASEKHYRHAIAIAKEQAALSWERRAAIALARLMVARGAGVDAKHMLKTVQEAFTDGFDSPDNDAAGRLLYSLNEVSNTRRNLATEI